MIHSSKRVLGVKSLRYSQYLWKHKKNTSIEQDANAVLFIHSLSKDSDDFDDRFLKLIIAKNRNGSVGKILMNFKTNILRFREGEFVDGKVIELPLSQLN